MPKVTQVEPQKRHSNRFNIYLDGEFAFGADEDLVVEQRLVVGKEISKENLDKLLYEAQVGKLMERIYTLFNLRLRSEKEVRDYLKRLNFKRRVKDQEEVSLKAMDLVIDKLKRKNLIDDEVFAKAWVEARSKKKGPRAIQAELFKKGIAKEIIEVETRGQLSDKSQQQTAAMILERKLKAWKNLPALELKKKAIEFLLRRGFDYSLSRDLVDKRIKKEYNNFEENEDYE